MGFDLAKYQLLQNKEVDLKETRKNVGIFMQAYLSARTRMGQPREPKVTQSFSLVPPSIMSNTLESKQLLIENEEAKEELSYLHDLFNKGYASIQHPFKPGITQRRRKVFYDRYISGLTIYVTAQRNFISEETVKQESIMSIVQFAESLEIAAYK